MKLKQILVEGKYDKYVLDLSRELINNFKKGKGYDTFFEMESKNGEYAEVELQVKFKKNPKLPYAYSISAGANFDEMDITIEWNPAMFPQAMSDLVAEVKETLRHEIEHIGQHNFEGKYIADKKEGPEYKDYLLQTDEVPAYVQGLFKRAKTKKISMPQAFDEWYKENKANFKSSKDWDDVKKVWTAWGKKNLPRAIWEGTLTNGLTAGEPESGYTPPGRARTLGKSKDDPSKDLWFTEGGWEQLEFPSADDMFGSDTQIRRRTDKIYNPAPNNIMSETKYGLAEEIRKVDGKWAVFPKKGGKRLGTHDTKEKALAQLAAIEASKNEGLDETKFKLPSKRKIKVAIEKLKRAAKKEGRETKAAGKLLWKMMFKGHKPSEEELKFLKGQSLDVLRVLGLIAIQGVPAPVPITPTILALQKKYKFNIIKPNSPEIPASLEKAIVEESVIGKVKNTIKVIVSVDKTKHAGERQSRHADTFITDAEIVKSANRAVPKISNMLMFDKIDIGDYVHVHDTITDLNLVGRLHDKNGEIEFKVITVMLKPNFKPKAGTFTIRV